MKKGPRQGFTLVEVVVSILIVLISSAGIGAIVLFASKSRTISARQQQAAIAAQLLRDTLRNYVIAAPPGGSPAPQDLASLNSRLTGFLGCASECYKIPGDACAWAFQPGCTHDATALLADQLRTGAPAGRMTYTVVPEGRGNAVQISVEWTEAAP